MRKFAFAALLSAVTAGPAFAGTLPVPGDIIFIEVHQDAPDIVSFVTLTDNLDLRNLLLTDNGWLGSALRTGEDETRLPNTTAWDNVPRGTRVTLVDTANAAWASNGSTPAIDNDSSDRTLVAASTLTGISASGDQIWIFAAAETQATVTAADFIAGINVTPNGFSANNSSNDTANPGTAGAYIINIADSDNVWYSGATTSGTAATLAAAISNPANWTGNNALTPPNALQAPTLTFNSSVDSWMAFEN